MLNYLEEITLRVKLQFELHLYFLINTYKFMRRKAYL